MGSSDRGVLLVGGAGAVGAATARWLAARGRPLVLVDVGCAPDGTGRDPGRLEHVVAVMRRDGAQVDGLALDAAGVAGARQVWEQAVERLQGPPSAVMWAAGISRRRSVRRASDEDVVVHLRLLEGALGLARRAVAAWAEAREGGALLLCVSPVAAFGVAGRALEATADAALTGFVRSAAVELRRLGVRVNALAPLARSRLTDDLPMFRAAPETALLAEHVAPVAGFLLSEQADGVSGEVVAVAGQRVYALRSRESAGVYFEELPSPEQLRDRWADVLRG